MRLARMATIGCLIILVTLIVYSAQGHQDDQGEVTDRRQGVSSVDGRTEATYQLKINDRWHKVDATTYRRCDIGEQHPACKHK